MTDSPKILFLDLDGTLLNDHKEVTPQNMAAIRAALDAGHNIVLASGRAASSVEAQAKKLSLTADGCYAIAFNGAAIYDLFRRRTIYRKTLSMDTARRILEATEHFGIYAHTYMGDRILTSRNTQELLKYSASTGMQYLVTDDLFRDLTQEPEKILVIDYENHQALLDFQECVQDLIRGRAQSFFSCPYYLEFVAPGVSKGAAVKTLCQTLGIPLEHTVSAGDAENDISMLRATRIGAVMKNADSSMYAYGNYITKRDNNHDAVAEIIDRFILRRE